MDSFRGKVIEWEDKENIVISLFTQKRKRKRESESATRNEWMRRTLK